MSFQVVVFSLREFNKDGKIQWLDSRDKAYEVIQANTKKFYSDLSQAITLAEIISRNMEFYGYMGDVVVREWHDNYDYCPTKYVITVTLDRSENGNYYVEIFTPTKAPTWDSYLSLTLQQAQDVVEDLMIRHKRRNYSVWIYPQNAPLGTQAVLAISNETKVKSV